MVIPLDKRKGLPRVVVAHPGMQQSPRTALALQRAGMLEAYVTRLYYHEALFPIVYLNRWPFLRTRLEPFLLGRQIDGLDPEKIVLFDVARGWIEPMLRRNRYLSRYLDYYRYHKKYFQTRTAKYAALNAQVLICYEMSAHYAFRRAKASGVKCILVMTAPHVVKIDKVTRYELKKNPDFSSTFTSGPTPLRVLEPFITAAKIADRIVVSSGCSAESVRALGVSDSKIDFVPLGIDLKAFVGKEPSHSGKTEFIILYAGTLTQMKGIKYLLEAVKRLNKPDVRLVMVGGKIGPQDWLKPYAGFTTVLDRVPRQELIDLYSKADIFVFPSLLEGFGKVILEAMAMGLPVITTTATAGEYIIEDGVDGFLVPPGNSDAIREKIQLLYENRELRKKAGIRAAKKARLYTWDRYAEGIIGSVMKAYSGGK
jgi:glycosyltransferase involved in cell wall biosynthesis